MQLSLLDLISEVYRKAHTALVGPRLNSRPTPVAPKKSAEIPAAVSSREKRSNSLTISEDRQQNSLEVIWLTLRKQWFPDREDLDQYKVAWSRRPQKRTLASCNITARKVVVARELNYPQLGHWLYPLLYHEMCHAVLGDSVVVKGRKSAWHGKEFKKLERRHPDIAALNKWIDAGGWLTAVRSDRAKRAHTQRRTKVYRSSQSSQGYALRATKVGK